METLNSLNIQPIIDTVATLQESNFALGGKYFYSIDNESEGFSYTVNEYVAPGDQKGYDIVFRAEVDGVKYTKGIGYGVEAESRTYDWMEITNI